MKKKFEIAVLTALLAAPLAAQAQGIPGGMERGAAEGNAAAGPVGGIVGGAVGGAVGGVNGVLGINPGPRYHRHWVAPLGLSLSAAPSLSLLTALGTSGTFGSDFAPRKRFSPIWCRLSLPRLGPSRGQLTFGPPPLDGSESLALSEAAREPVGRL